MTKTNMALTDGGLETWLVFHAGFDLPCFAAFPLLESDRKCDALRRYFEPFLAVAEQRDCRSSWIRRPGVPRPIGVRSSGMAATASLTPIVRPSSSPASLRERSRTSASTA